MPPGKDSLVQECFRTVTSTDPAAKSKAQCKFCGKEYAPNTTRQRGHILKECKQVPINVKARHSAFSPLHSTANEEAVDNPNSKRGRAAREISKSDAFDFVRGGVGSRQQIQRRGNETVSIHGQIRRSCRCRRKEISRRIVCKGDVRHREYQECVSSNKAQIEKAPALGIMTDSFTNIRQESVIDIVVTTPRPVLYKQIFRKTERETGEFVGNEIKKVVMEIGPEKFWIFVTDNAANMQTEKYGHKSISLKLPGKTRWAGTVILLNSLLQNKSALQETVICENLVDTVDVKVRRTVLDPKYWERTKCIYDLLSPLHAAITLIESNRALLSDAYYLHKKINECVKSNIAKIRVSSSEKQVVKDLLADRKVYTIAPIHMAAYLLDPRFQGEGLENKEIADAIHHISKLAGHMGLDEGEVIANLGEYRTKVGFFATNSVWDAARKLYPAVWWRGVCATEALSAIAACLLSMPPSAAEVERRWSDHGFIHNKKRNRLLNTRVTKLTTVRATLVAAKAQENKQDPLPVAELEEFFQKYGSESLGRAGGGGGDGDGGESEREEDNEEEEGGEMESDEESEEESTDWERESDSGGESDPEGLDEEPETAQIRPALTRPPAAQAPAQRRTRSAAAEASPTARRPKRLRK
ncbi:hypothetical protein KUF71_025569 [Frankliniella fusca]|uniref:HAT C-terminal dimerisation domain-containing protein n=1 Tax=Frankliniella fusca TaxID=407009 RepID=A0AAE1LUI3_9NEOP|nr:hypothetical protein KUF71_025569 [Frankliniella fusca]